ncbi:DmsE family decaheme c-type cytochrome [Kaarinaea lacus]
MTANKKKKNQKLCIKSSCISYLIRVVILHAIFLSAMSHAANETGDVSGQPSLKKALSENPSPEGKGLYTRKGADTCLKCHDEDYKYPIYPVFFSKHGDINDKRTPMGQLQCESCHGPGRAHATEPRVGFKRAKIISFGAKGSVSPAEQNQQCTQCHNGSSHVAWEGSAHEVQNILCVDCHVLHKRKDPVLDKTLQPNKCYTCHKKQRGEFARNSAHPVRQGKMVCTQCHNPHGSLTDGLLKTSTRNDTCYKCHAEKRGPFLWTHAPVAEDCGTCHEFHGSLHAPLLKKRAPLLCQQCHTSGVHPSAPYDESGLPTATPSAYLLAKSCLNCHSQVHGSNHPSGVKLMR